MDIRPRERLKKEYGQTKVVVNAHMDGIINLTPVKGSNYSKVQEFFEKLSKNFDALQTLEEGDKLQRALQASLQSRGWKLVEEKHTGILKCEGRVKGYRPMYLPGGPLAEKLVAHVHNQIMHLGVATTMASVRESGWIPKLRARVK